MKKSRIITVKGAKVTITTRHEQDYISLTDMVRNFDGGSALIEQWLKNKDTVLFLGVWEQLNNPGFNSLEFEGIGWSTAVLGTRAAIDGPAFNCGEFATIGKPEKLRPPCRNRRLKRQP